MPLELYNTEEIRQPNWFVRIGIPFLIVLIFKAVASLYFGAQLFPDSYNYLECVTHAHYPAIYPTFLQTSLSVWESLDFVVFLQCVGFAFATTVFFSWTKLNARWSIILAIVIGLEPMSTLYCRSIMSEAVFIPLLLLWLGAVIQQLRTQKGRWALFAGLLAGLMYGTRFAAVIPAAIPIIIWLLQKKHLVRSWKYIPLYLFAFQAVLVPLRLNNQIVFRTFELNGLTGANLWNSTSPLFEESSEANNPETSFGKYVAAFDSSELTVENAINARQIWDTTLAFQNYNIDQKYGFEMQFQSSAEAGEVGKKLLKENPIGYLTEFVWPNFNKQFTQDFSYAALDYPNYNADSSRETVRFPAFIWIIEFSVFVLSILLFYVAKFRFVKVQLEAWLLTFLTIYIFAIPFVAAVNIRYYTSVSFIILIVFILLTVKMLNGSTEIKT